MMQHLGSLCTSHAGLILCQDTDLGALVQVLAQNEPRQTYAEAP